MADLEQSGKAAVACEFTPYWKILSSNWTRDHPKKSTWVAAMWLSIWWILAWLLIFFFTTLVLGLRTGAIAFIVTFWLSILAESFIRYLENTDGVAKYSKPTVTNAKGDNQDFTRSRAVILFFNGATILAIAGALWYFLGGRIASYIPHPDTVRYNGYILVDRGDLILRGAECSVYRNATIIELGDESLKVLKKEQNEIVEVTPEDCSNGMEISPSERIEFSGLDNPDRGASALGKMIIQWTGSLSKLPILLTLLFGFTMRIFIYKRSVPEG